MPYRSHTSGSSGSASFPRARSRAALSACACAAGTPPCAAKALMSSPYRENRLSAQVAMAYSRNWPSEEYFAVSESYPPSVLLETSS